MRGMLCMRLCRFWRECQTGRVLRHRVGSKFLKSRECRLVHYNKTKGNRQPCRGALEVTKSGRDTDTFNGSSRRKYQRNSRDVSPMRYNNVYMRVGLRNRA